MKLEILNPDLSINFTIPLVLTKVEAGFPSPADDYIEDRLNLNDYLIKNPSSTFFARVKGYSMKGASIQEGDILVIDRSIEPANNKIVVAYIDNEFTVKRIAKANGKLYLLAENPGFKPIEITDQMDFKVWGVVTYIVKEAK